MQVKYRHIVAQFIVFLISFFHRYHPNAAHDSVPPPTKLCRKTSVLSGWLLPRRGVGCSVRQTLQTVYRITADSTGWPISF
jgi:hypothetical protein